MSLVRPVVAPLLIGLCALAPLAAHAGDDHLHSDLTPEKEVVKITRKGPVPPKLVLTKVDSSVFFVNATADDLLTISIDFGSHKPHCASSNMKYDEKGIIRSNKPIAPKDFAIACFPEPGTYEVEIAGLNGGRETSKAIVVSE